MSRNGLSRRRAVQVSGSVLLAALAGCPGNGGQNGTQTTAGGTGTGTAGTGTAETETAETGTAGTGTAETGTAETGTAETGTAETGTPSLAPSVSVSDQQTSGETVTVSSVTIDRAGWLVIHPVGDRGGPAAGTALGATQLQPGTSSNVTVQLDQPLSESQTLYAMLHYDIPDDGKFSFTPSPSDDPPVPVMESFEVTVQ